MTVDAYLIEMGRTLGLALKLDDGGRCTLTCDGGFSVEIAWLARADAVLLTAPLLDSPVENASALHRFALLYAHDLDRTRGAAVSIDPSANDRPELQLMRRLDELDARSFRTMVGGFILVVQETRAAFDEHIAMASDTTADSETAFAEEPPHDAAFIRV